MAADLDAYSDDDVMAAIQRRKDGPTSSDDENVKPAEFDVMASGKARLGRNDPESVFYMETLEPAIWRTPGDKLLDSIRRVVVIPRLREVVAQSGFTRFDALAPDEDGELDMGVERAALARALTWLPAVEHKGEGIFVQFDAGAIDVWRERAAVKERGVALRAGYDAWRKDRPNTRRDFPGVAYVMMHSLAHMLLTTIALESGYAASSLRERIYGSDGRYGILIYTATSGAEGTLGGLVATARNIGTHLARALETAVLCSNDPVCAEHKPDDRLTSRPLHGAACHGCLLIAETSCEQRNDFLDRALVVETVAGDEAALFSRSALDGSDG